MALIELGERIRTLRLQRGLTQRYLASSLDVTAQAVYKWERGDNAPDFFLLPGLAALLNTSIDSLMGYERRPLRSVEGTLFFSSLAGFAARGERTSAEDLAVYLNSHFYSITECVTQRSGLPIKYMGDGFLATFMAGDHRQNAVRAALAARSVSSDSLAIGISTGQFYMGPIGHPDFAHLDVIGDFVNIAARVQAWAGRNTKSGIAATAETMAGCPGDIHRSDAQLIEIKGKSSPVTVHEVVVGPE